MYSHQRFHRLFSSRRKRKRTEVNGESWFDSRRSQSQNRQTCCSKARIAQNKNTWTHFQDTVFWCKLKLAQQRGLNFYQTRSNAVIHYTLPAEFIEKAICMKTKDQLYVRKSVILRLRFVLKINSQSGSQDLLVQEARSFWGIATR